MIGASGEEMTRAEADRAEAEDLIAWAREHAPELLPEYEDEDEEWIGVIDALRSAKHYADWQARPAQPAPTGGFEPEPF